MTITLKKDQEISRDHSKVLLREEFRPREGRRREEKERKKRKKRRRKKG